MGKTKKAYDHTKSGEEIRGSDKTRRRRERRSRGQERRAKEEK